MPPLRQVGSLRSQLWLLWVFIVLVSAALASILIGLYRVGSSAEVGAGQRATHAGCQAIRSLIAANFPSEPPASKADKDLLAVLISEALAELQGVEGGVWVRGAGFLAYAYPTHEGATPKLDMPASETPWILGLAQQAASGSTAEDLRRGSREAVVLVACPLQSGSDRFAAWTMMRIRTNVANAYDGLAWGLALLLGFVLVSGGWLAHALSRWSGGVSALERTLAHHPLDDLPPLARSGQPDIDRVVDALNLFTERLATARKQSGELARQLAQSDRLAALGRVAAGVAHEIRNPIGAMRLKAENALAQSPERQGTALQTILGQIDRLDRLCEQLLSATPPLSLELRAVTASVWLEARLQALREKPEAAQLSLTSTCSVGTAAFDPVLLGRALDNLLLNALQHTPAGGRIDVTLAHAGDALQLTVSDTGPGIAEAVRPHLFEPFTSAREGGTGLGLAIAREMVEAHGGTIRLVPSAVGAVFEMELPWRRS
jgi:signal transduction histidine kinase